MMLVFTDCNTKLVGIFNHEKRRFLCLSAVVSYSEEEKLAIYIYIYIYIYRCGGALL
jgi:hypothetical protein